MGFAVSEWCFRGVESRCSIGICNAECLLRSSLLREVSCKTLVLEAWIVILVKVSWKMLVLEAWIHTFDESLVEKALLWKCGLSLCGESEARVFSKSVKKECQARVSCQQCQAKVSSKSVK